MLNSILQIKNQLQEIWGKTTRAQKIMIIALPLVVFITLTVFIFGAYQPDYQALSTFKNLEEAGVVVNNLKEKKVDYKLSDDGLTIYVPSKDIAQTRLDIASSGLPTGGVVGMEIFDQQKFGETDSDRKVNYVRAIQGELTRTIQKLDGVEDARVQVVMPEPSLYSDEQKDATASIMLKLKPFKKIEENQIKGLVSMVAGSVEGLKPENITVVDTKMHDLTEGLDLKDDESTPAKLTLTQFQLQQDYQKDMQKDLQSMLERIYGEGKAVVRVNVELDFDQVEKNSEKYGEGKVRSEQINEETAKGTSSSPTGVPGTTTNTPAPTYQESTGSTNTETEKSEKVRNYEIDKTQEHRLVAPGSVKQLSVAVVVDGQVNSKQKQDIEGLVKSAAGVNTERGDQVSVSSMQFDTQYQDELKKDMENQAAMQSYLLFGSIGLVIVILGVILIVFIKRRKEQQAAELKAHEDELGSIVNLTVDDFILPEKELTPEELAKEKIREQVEQVAKDNPDSVAQLLRSWLAEE